MELRQLLLLVILVGIVPIAANGQPRPGPFTAPQRSVRSRDIDQKHVRLELRFDWEKEQVQGRAVHTISPYKPLRELQLDAAEMQISKVVLTAQPPQTSDRELKHRTVRHSLHIELDREYKPDETLTLSIEYTIVRPRHGIHFVTPDESEPDQPKMVWTQSEPEFARYWFPCIDSPSERLTSEILATVPESFFVLSNGVQKSKTKNPDGTQTWHWAQTQSHTPYLLSVVAGDFEAYEQEWDGIPVISYVPRGRLADAPRSFSKTAAMVKYFSQRIGVRYPWPKYAQICVDEYMWGGMEHTSATTLTLRTLHDERGHLDESSDNLVAHELAHQWWGDLLTCKEWGELWLNESFATYFATLWMEQDQGWDEAVWARSREAGSYLEEDAKYRRSIVNYRYNSPENMFDGHSYPKGGRVLHMLRFELGDELFWKVMNRYATVNQHRTVETADLRIAIEDATGQGMNWFFDQWVYRGGHPEFRVSWRWDDAAGEALVEIKQVQTADDVTPLFRTAVEIELATGKEVTLRRVQVSKVEETFHFQLPRRPTRVAFDPNDWILKTLKFEKSKEELLDQLEHDPHVICRVQAAQGLAAFSADDDVESALSRSARSDGFWSVRQETVKSLGKARGNSVRQALLTVAASDARSEVRRESVRSLGEFAHDDTRSQLRKLIKEDKSYFVVAEALRTLVKVDREHAAADLLAALDQTSHEEVILDAASDGLVELKHIPASDRVAALLSVRHSPQRRVALMGLLAKLKPEDAVAYDAVVKQLENDRLSVRRAAIASLVAIGKPSAISILLERREKEESPRMLRTLDESIEKLRSKERDLDALRRELEEVRQKNRDLDERLKRLEKK